MLGHVNENVKCIVCIYSYSIGARDFKNCQIYDCVKVPCVGIKNGGWNGCEVDHIRRMESIMKKINV